MSLEIKTMEKDTRIPRLNGREYAVIQRLFWLCVVMSTCAWVGQAQPVQNTHGGEALFSVFSVPDLDTALASRLSVLETRYNIKIYSQERSLAGDIVSDSVARRYLTYRLISERQVDSRNLLLKTFAEEWEKYPPDFVKNIGLKSVVFVSDLAVSGQRRYAMPEAQYHALYFDISYVNARSDEYLRHCIHHEFHHLVQYKTFDNFYYKDPTWSSFNVRKFRYGDGGATAYGKKIDWDENHPQKGFMSAYSTFGIEEDMAEIFAFLMTTSEFPVLMKWIKRDRIIANKVAYLLGMIAVESKELNLTYLSGLHNQGDH